MTVPQWALLGFAVWTLLVLFGTVGVYRWSRILTGRVRISEWQAGSPQGSDWYQRAMRAHMNCVENLPVFAAIVLCATAAGADSRLLDLLAGAILVARICQTTVHLTFTPSDLAASVRFAFFFVQAICMLAMATSVAVSAAE
ncbi:MAPEG family protein [Microvirga sp. CF3016]|uniref:MAPEG family protein n=1 Tax=Microvirga sp. CF3016 TaxID=3110181 RepID=UPI002E764A61|nr:MAPEG family protein [Microvirga sp. CF3016]MEE1612448.1 MAPEG family protein [Microvirga sp. CF3016]